VSVVLQESLRLRLEHGGVQIAQLGSISKQMGQTQRTCAQAALPENLGDTQQQQIEQTVKIARMDILALGQGHGDAKSAYLGNTAT
jgi:hypothetical protein